MKHLSILLLFSIVFSFYSKAQSDSIQYETYDVIELVDGGYLKGEILSFNEETGGMVFKDTKGVKYFFDSDDYESFIENKQYPIKQKKKIILKPRKEEGFEFGVGLFLTMLNRKHDLTKDDVYINAPTSYGDFLLTLKLSAGKYLKKANYVGLWGEIPFATSSETYFSIGGRYSHQYDKQKSNVASYFLVDVYFNQNNFSMDYSINDTVFSDNGYEYPRYSDVTIKQSSLGLSLGQGFGFILNNKKSLNVEFSIQKHFILSQSYSHTEMSDPDSKFSVLGFKLGVGYNF